MGPPWLYRYRLLEISEHSCSFHAGFSKLKSFRRVYLPRLVKYTRNHSYAARCSAFKRTWNGKIQCVKGDGLITKKRKAGQCAATLSITPNPALRLGRMNAILKLSIILRKRRLSKLRLRCIRLSFSFQQQTNVFQN